MTNALGSGTEPNTGEGGGPSHTSDGEGSQGEGNRLPPSSPPDDGRSVVRDHLSSRLDLIERMFFNGVTTIVLALLTLATGGVIFRFIDTRQIELATNRAKEQMEALEDRVNRNYETLKNAAEQVDQARSKLLDQEVQYRKADLENRFKSVEAANTDLARILESHSVSLSAFGADDLTLNTTLQHIAEIVRGRPDSDPEVKPIVQRLHELERLKPMSSILQSRLSDLDFRTIQLARALVIQQLEIYEEILQNITLHNVADDDEMQSIRENQRILEIMATALTSRDAIVKGHGYEQSDALNPSDRSPSVDMEGESMRLEILRVLELLKHIHQALRSYDNYLKGDPQTETLKEARQMVKQCREKCLESLNDSYGEHAARFDAYITNLLGLLRLKEYQDQRIHHHEATLDECAALFRASQERMASFDRAYSNLAVVEMHRLQLPAYRSDGSVGEGLTAQQRAIDIITRSKNILATAIDNARTTRSRAVLDNNRAHVMLEEARIRRTYSLSGSTQPTDSSSDAMVLLDDALRLAQHVCIRPDRSSTALITQAEIRCFRIHLNREAWREPVKCNAEAQRVIQLIETAVWEGFTGFRKTQEDEFDRMYPYLSMISLLDTAGSTKHYNAMLKAAGIKK